MDLLELYETSILPKQHKCTKFIDYEGRRIQLLFAFDTIPDDKTKLSLKATRGLIKDTKEYQAIIRKDLLGLYFDKERLQEIVQKAPKVKRGALACGRVLYKKDYPICRIETYGWDNYRYKVAMKVVTVSDDTIHCYIDGEG